MGRATINNRINPGDIEKLAELHTKINPHTPVPDFGANDTELMIMRDEADQTRIVGCIVLEHALEVRAIYTDPDYELRQQALSHGFCAMETRIRCGDFGVKDRYYVSVPTAHHHVQKFYRDEGAVVIDQNATRYMKRLT